MQKILINSSAEKEVKDISADVRRAVEEAGEVTGICHLFLLHTTAASTTADVDPDADRDMPDAFAAWVPRLKYRHPHDPAQVQDHILSSVLGASLAIPVENGQMLLGAWQRIVLLEFDGPRQRDVVISITPERE